MIDIKYDVVGSFLRTDAIHKARSAFSNGEITLEQLRNVENEEIAKLVEKEVKHGLKFVTDGEFRRKWWHLDWLKEFNGFSTNAESFLECNLNGKVNQIERGHICGKIFYDPEKNHPEVDAFDFLRKEAEKYPGITPKKCISGPNMILVENYLGSGISDVPYYGTNIDAVIEDIGLAYQAAIKDFYNHGCRYLQIDDVSWMCMVDEKYLEKAKSQGYTKEQVLEWFLRVSTKALENRPSDMTIATHFCKGNFKGHALLSGFYDSVAATISKVPYDIFFVEYDDARSGTFAPWTVLKNSNAIFVAGLISTKNSELENHDILKQRYLEAKKVIGTKIALSPQCGFASVEEGNCMDEEIQWKKIDLLVSCKDFL